MLEKDIASGNLACNLFRVTRKNMKTFLTSLLLATFLVLHAQTPRPEDLLATNFHFAPVNPPAVTNTLPTTNALTSADAPATNSAGSIPGPIPIIRFTDVPLTTAIENLALGGNINYLLEPGLFPATDEQGNPVPEPVITIRWENISARDALDRLCNHYNLIRVENPYTHIARITSIGEPRHFIDPTLLDLTTNPPAAGASAAHTSPVIPVIRFTEVPLDVALINLIRATGRQIELASNLMETVVQTVDSHGKVKFLGMATVQGSPEDKWFQPMPLLSLRWEGVSAEQAIVALCDNYDLDLVPDAATGNLQIVPRKIKVHHHLKHY